MENTFSNRLKKLKEKLVITQRDIQDKAGITQSTVSNIESGKTQPELETIRKIAEAYKVNPVWLETGEGEMMDIPYD